MYLPPGQPIIAIWNNRKWPPYLQKGLLSYWLSLCLSIRQVVWVQLFTHLLATGRAGKGGGGGWEGVPRALVSQEEPEILARARKSRAKTRVVARLFLRVSLVPTHREPGKGYAASDFSSYEVTWKEKCFVISLIATTQKKKNRRKRRRNTRGFSNHVPI